MDQAAIGIRDYQPSDLDALIELFRASVRQTAGQDYTHEQILAWAPDHIDRESFASRNLSRPTWVAEVNSLCAGFADLEPNGHLDRMFVHPDYLRRGVASALIARVEAAAEEHHLGRIYAEVSITARPFFESKGFRVVVGQTVTVRGREFFNYQMEKLLHSDPTP